ncbi:MAG TPA: DUF86 domain-containing protein [Spirochaetota bacterium]|nr:DUF86 domain-containing protein [Spirochaetota bacterium]
MSDRNLQNIFDIAEAAEKILTYTSGISNADQFFRQSLVFDAVMMNFVVIGESVSRLSDDFINLYPAINWYKIKGLRNIIAHDYFGIDAEEIWQIIINDIPVLIHDVKGIIDEFRTKK